MTFIGGKNIIKNGIKKKRYFQEAVESPAQVRYCKSQILDTFLCEQKEPAATGSFLFLFIENQKFCCLQQNFFFLQEREIMDRKNGLEDYYVIRNQKKMRFGYTTGSCAAAAVKGAVEMLLGGKSLSEVTLMTPKGIPLFLELKDVCQKEQEVSCAVEKDGGDDPDTTHGLWIYAKAQRMDSTEEEAQPGDFIKEVEGFQVILRGGVGVGRVTKPGLTQKIGEPAINKVPRAMIFQEVHEAVSRYGGKGTLLLTIYVPEGEERGKRTFNPRLGIQGGISILGTTGIVEPMSEKALIESIGVEMRQHVAQGETYLLVTPGNYGAEYLKKHGNLPFERNIKCSNYVGETIDMAVNLGVKGILFVAHIGKFVKVGAGIMNTHSHSADGRMEILASNAIRAGGTLSCAKAILDCQTTDEALEILEKNDLLQPAMKDLTQRIQFYLDHRSYEQIQLGAVIFSNEKGWLGQSPDAEALMHALQQQEQRLCGK